MDCQTGKITYASPQEAWRAVKNFSRRRKGALSPYKCPFCKLWHLTSIPRDRWEKE